MQVTVTFTVNGENTKTGDKIAIRLIVEFTNSFTSSCDIDFDVLSVDKFEFSVSNTTAIDIKLDLAYSDKENEADLDALKTLLEDYKVTIAEEKDMPFDKDSLASTTFDKLKLEKAFPLGSSGLFLKLTITPFIDYKLVGQMSIHTYFAVTNTFTTSYVKGDFNFYHNCETDKQISVYALVYIRIDLGVSLEVKLYVVGLEKYVNVAVEVAAGPYVEASGVLKYNYDNGTETMDLAGYFEWGYFYDVKISATLLKTFAIDPDRVDKPLGSIGTYYLYFEFKEETEELTVEEYTIEIYESIDHSLYAYDLRELGILDGHVEGADMYEYVLEENGYVYINRYNQLKIIQCPKNPITIKLYVTIGNMAKKTVYITLDVKQHDVVVMDTEDGTVNANKPYAMIGEKVSFVFEPDMDKMLANSEYLIVQGWIVNGEFVDYPYAAASFEMEKGGLYVEVVTERLTNVKFVRTPADLDNVRNDLSATYVQIADINMSGRAFTPIGSLPSASFTGRYYGNGYTVRNLTIGTSNAIISDYAPPYDQSNETVALLGMFASLDNAIIHSLSIENANVFYSGSPSNHDNKTVVYASVISAISKDTRFYNCSVTDSKINVNHERSSSWKRIIAVNSIGAVSAFSYSSVYVDNCLVSDMQITSNAYGSDGVVGSIWGSIISDWHHTGGIIGTTEGFVEITTSYVSMDVTTDKNQNYNIGTLVGLIDKYDSYPVRLYNAISDVQVNGELWFYIAIFQTPETDEQKENYNDIMTNPERIRGFVLLRDGSAYEGDGTVYTEEEVECDEFLYDFVEFDPMLWDIVNDEIVKVN